MARRCRHPDGIRIMPDGVHEILPCIVETKEIHRNVTLYVRQCPICGHIDLAWEAQPDSEHIIYGQLGPEPDDE